MQKSTKYMVFLIPFLLFCCKNTDKGKSIDESKPTHQEEKLEYKSTLNSSPIETGHKIALKTKGILGKNLLQAIYTKGTENALTFCSNRAIPLTDSMALSQNAKIKRVSDRNRNPNNKPSQAELAYIEAAKATISQDIEPKPELFTIGDRHVGYYPIIANQMCMKCHGQPKTEVLPPTLSKIESLYPYDKALGYKVGQLRGIWVVEMDKELPAHTIDDYRKR